MGAKGSGPVPKGTPKKWVPPKDKESRKPGRPPSEGKAKEPDAVQALIDLDPEFRKHVIEQFVGEYDNALNVLLEIRDRKVTDERFDTKTGDVVTIKVPNDVRIKAIAQWFKMTGDKTMADKRDSGNDKDKGNTGDLTKALQLAEAKMTKKREEAEQKAKDSGKLVSIEKAKEATG